MLKDPWKTNCACVPRRGNGIMASRNRYGSRMREAKMFVLMLLVSQTKRLSLCRVKLQRVSVTLPAGVFVRFFKFRRKRKSTSLLTASPSLSVQEVKLTAPWLNLGLRFSSLASAMWVVSVAQVKKKKLCFCNCLKQSGVVTNGRLCVRGPLPQLCPSHWQNGRIGPNELTHLSV